MSDIKNNSLNETFKDTLNESIDGDVNEIVVGSLVDTINDYDITNESEEEDDEDDEYYWSDEISVKARIELLKKINMFDSFEEKDYDKKNSNIFFSMCHYSDNNYDYNYDYFNKEEITYEEEKENYIKRGYTHLYDLDDDEEHSIIMNKVIVKLKFDISFERLIIRYDNRVIDIIKSRECEFDGDKGGYIKFNDSGFELEIKGDCEGETYVETNF